MGVRPATSRPLIFFTLIGALLFLILPRLSMWRRARPARARTRYMADEKTKRITMRHLGLATAGVIAILAVTGGSLALALGVLGQEELSPARVPIAAAGSGSVVTPDRVSGAFPPLLEIAETPVPGSAGSDESSPAAGGDQPIGPQTPPALAGMPENVDASPQLLALKDVLAQEITAHAGQGGGSEVAVAVTELETGQTMCASGNAV